MASSTPTSRTSHSISSSAVSTASSIPNYSFSMHSTSTTNSSSHSNAVINHSLANQISSKYDFGHSTGTASLHSSQTSSASSLSNSNYIQATNNMYNNVKSETNTNYDWQNGYFNASYGSAIAPSAATVSHSVSDLASYHHIQAAKLMATS